MNCTVHSKAESNLNATILANQTGLYFKLFVLPYYFVSETASGYNYGFSIYTRKAQGMSLMAM